MKQSSGQKGMVASFKTVYNLEKDYCGMISAGWDQFIGISDQPNR